MIDTSHGFSFSISIVIFVLSFRLDDEPLIWKYIQKQILLFLYRLKVKCEDEEVTSHKILLKKATHTPTVCLIVMSNSF